MNLAPKEIAARRGLSLVLILAAVATGLTACQGGKSDENTSASQTLQIQAKPDGSPGFLRLVFFAKSGKLTIEFTNESTVPHNVTIVGPVTQKFTKAFGPPEIVPGPSAKTEATETISKSSTSVTIEVESAGQNRAGEYYFYCSVDGHEAAGMSGEILVRD